MFCLFSHKVAFSDISIRKINIKCKSICRHSDGGAPPQCPPPRALGGTCPPGPYGRYAPVIGYLLVFTLRVGYRVFTYEGSMYIGYSHMRVFEEKKNLTKVYTLPRHPGRPNALFRNGKMRISPKTRDL